MRSAALLRRCAGWRAPIHWHSAKSPGNQRLPFSFSSLIRSPIAGDDDEPAIAVDHLVVGAGVTGLAVAHRLLQHYRQSPSIASSNNLHGINGVSSAAASPLGDDADATVFRVLIVDRNRFLAEEQSSRNSEAIHGEFRNYFSFFCWRHLLRYRIGSDLMSVPRVCFHQSALLMFDHA